MLVILVRAPLKDNFYYCTPNQAEMQTLDSSQKKLENKPPTPKLPFIKRTYYYILFLHLRGEYVFGLYVLIYSFPCTKGWFDMMVTNKMKKWKKGLVILLAATLVLQGNTADAGRSVTTFAETEETYQVQTKSVDGTEVVVEHLTEVIKVRDFSVSNVVLPLSRLSNRSL